MEMLAQMGYFGSFSPEASSLYGLLMMLASVWLVFNTDRPDKKD